MTAHLFLVPPGSLDAATSGTVVDVTGAEGHHAVSVLRLRLGESVFVGDGRGVRAAAEVVDIDRSRLTVRVSVVERENVPALRWVLVQALAKGDRDTSAVETATEFGVDEIVPWQADRSVSVWRADKVERGRQRWEDVAVAAAKQSRRFTVPTVSPMVRTRELAARVGGGGTAYLLHEEATEPLSRVALPTSGEVLLVVGPEGGIAPAELELLVACGATPVRLGAEVLRTSSAGPAAIAVLNAMTRWR